MRASSARPTPLSHATLALLLPSALLLSLLLLLLLLPSAAAQAVVLHVSPTFLPTASCAISDPCSLPAAAAKVSAIFGLESALLPSGSDPANVTVLLGPGSYGPDSCGAAFLGPLFNANATQTAVNTVSSGAPPGPGSLALNIPSLNLLASRFSLSLLLPF